jgi:hypothetical protein
MTMKTGVPIAIAVLLLAGGAMAAERSTPGTKETVTFEGLVAPGGISGIGGFYDGLGWSRTIFAVGKNYKPTRGDSGFQAVRHGKVAAGNFENGTMDIFKGTNYFWVQSGHFAAFGNGAVPVTFTAYRNGIVLGTKSMTLDPADTTVTFDGSFAHADTFEIDGNDVAMDNLKVRFFSR